MADIETQWATTFDNIKLLLPCNLSCHLIGFEDNSFDLILISHSCLRFHALTHTQMQLRAHTRVHICTKYVYRSVGDFRCWLSRVNKTWLNANFQVGKLGLAHAKRHLFYLLFYVHWFRKQTLFRYPSIVMSMSLCECVRTSYRWLSFACVADFLTDVEQSCWLFDVWSCIQHKLLHHRTYVTLVSSFDVEATLRLMKITITTKTSFFFFDYFFTVCIDAVVQFLMCACLVWFSFIWFLWTKVLLLVLFKCGQ